MAFLESLYLPYTPPVEFNPSIYWKKCERCLTPIVSREVGHCLVCTSVDNFPPWAALDKLNNPANKYTIAFHWGSNPVLYRDIVSVTSPDLNNKVVVMLRSGKSVWIYY